MIIEEQKRIAFDQGKLAAWLGHAHIVPRFYDSTELYGAWLKGVHAQCKIMSDAAAKIPLLFADEKADRSMIESETKTLPSSRTFTRNRCRECGCYWDTNHVLHADEREYHSKDCKSRPVCGKVSKSPVTQDVVA